MKDQHEPVEGGKIVPAVQPRADHTPMTARQLAHELNSLLDGAARCVRQVQAQFTDTAEMPDTQAIDRKLNMVRAAMQQMTELLERTMNATEPGHGVLSNHRQLGEFVPELIASLRPKADEHAIVFNLHMTNDAAAVPTGPLGSVLLNGLTNAIDACAESPILPRVIEVSISISSRSELVALISDTGPGVAETCRTDARSIRSTKPHGHGIGLELCRQIVDELGGHFQLMNIPFGAGAIFQVRVPLPRLRAA